MRIDGRAGPTTKLPLRFTVELYLDKEEIVAPGWLCLAAVQRASPPFAIHRRLRELESRLRKQIGENGDENDRAHDNPFPTT